MDSDPDDPTPMEEDVVVPSPPAPIQTTNKFIHEVQLVDSDEDLQPAKKSKDGGDSDSSIEIEEQKKRRFIVWQCIEPDCTSNRKSELITANNYILSCYNIKPDPKKKRKICSRCNDNWMLKLEEHKEKLRNKEPLLDQPLPVPRDIVMLEDSDEKSETDSSESSEFEVDLTSGDDSEDPVEAVNKLIASLVDQYGIRDQCSGSVSALTERMNEMKPTQDHLTQRFNALEAEVQLLNRELYQDFEPERQELPALDIPLAHEEPQQQPRPLQGQQPRLNPMAQQLPQQHLKQHQQPKQQLSMRQQYQQQQLGRVPPQQSPRRRPLPGRVGPGGPAGPAALGAARPNNVPQQAKPNQTYVPPPGTLERPQPKLGDSIFMMRGQNFLNIWREGKVEEIVSVDDSGANFKIKFENHQSGKRMMQSKVRSLKQLAYHSPATVKIGVGVRVIGMYREHEHDKGAFYAGIVAEPPKSLNENRYLVFFDDGVARYIVHKELRVVCQSSVDVAEDIHDNSKEFIKSYLKRYPERPMVKLYVGQVVKTEYEGKWHITRVKQVDASLVRLEFDQGQRLEWIYRGSTRLGPLFTELEKQNLRKEQGTTAFQAQRRQRVGNAPLIEYTRQGNDGGLDADGAPKLHDASGVKKQNVARKSMGNRRNGPNYNIPDIPRESEGNVVKVDVSERRVRGKPFVRHSCSPKCIEDPKYQYNEAAMRGTNPLLIPLLLGWDRSSTSYYGKVGNARRSKKVIYTAPCGRRIRDLDEVHRYLRITQSSLEIDFFNYEWYLSVFDEFKPKHVLSSIPDMSYGKENVPISCVNSVENNYPEYVEYSNTRIPKDKVFINTDPEFLIGCNCVDDCQDKDSCACQQLTIQATGCDASGKINHNAGYKFRRLTEIVSTGIYECNSKCACAKTCLNRVVQHPLRNKLQVFKTKKRGWGIRTLVDIPAGAFICIYVGNLFESEQGNLQGQNFGDEYFAQLDLIEIVESRKEGYESDFSDDDLPVASINYTSSQPVVKPPPSSTRRDISSRIAELSTEDEDDDDNSGVQDDDKEYNPTINIKPRNTDRVSRSRVPQSDGLGSGSESTDTEEENDLLNSPSDDEEEEVRSSKLDHSSVKRVDLNQLIQKPDPFLSGQVKRVNLRDTGVDDILVEMPGQTDGPNDFSDDDEMEVLNEKKPMRSGFSATAGISGPKKQKKPAETFKSSRKFFGHAEDSYIMDAKSIGNIGRYLNHSCGPNCFVQSVFVDTHDLRFHWVAFFSSVNISAGSELSWDYSYEVGSIPGKELFCECGAEQCRGRLL